MIKFLVMDVDGTLTDGKIYMSDKGELFKAFDIKDGCGIKDILPQINIIPIIITARKSKIVFNRSKELGITHLYQGYRNKMDKLLDIIKKYNVQNKTNYDLSNVAYIGDDLLDLSCIKKIVENGGIGACPNDAIREVKEAANVLCTCAGGNGAVRELIEILKSKGENSNER